MYYTIGQRKGLNLGGNDDKLFVVGKNVEKIYYMSPLAKTTNIYTQLKPLSKTSIT